MNTTLRTIHSLIYLIKYEFLSLFYKNKRNLFDLNKRDILLLSFKLPPALDSGTFRPLSFIRYAKKNNWKISAVTDPLTESSSTKQGKDLLSLIPDEACIERFDSRTFEASWKLTTQLDGGLTNALSLVHYCVRKTGEDFPSAIIASGPPFYFAVAGMYLSKIFGCKFILDYRDEWTLCPFEFTSKTKIDSWFEKRCISSADLIIYTTESQRARHELAFSIDNKKQTVITNGWENEPENSTREGEILLNPEKINISYIGKLSSHSDPFPFLLALDQSISENDSLEKKIAVNFVGQKSQALLNSLSTYTPKNYEINLISAVSPSKAKQFMKESSILLMICEERLENYIPGKIFDYLAAKRKILAYGHKGETSRILEKNRAGVFIELNDTNSIYREIGNLDEPSDFSHIDTYLEKHSREYLAKEMFSRIDTLF